MALPELLDGFVRDADAQVRAIAGDADADVARIAAAAEQMHRARLAEATRAFAAEQHAGADVRIADASRHARADVLAARAAMLERVKQATAAQLAELVPHVASAVIAAAIDGAGSEPGVLRCAPAIGELARAAAPASLRVEADPRVATGAIVELANGTRIDATLAALLAREWPRLACEAIALADEPAREVDALAEAS